MRWGLRVDVRKAQAQVVLIHALRRDAASDNLAEQAIGIHTPTSLKLLLRILRPTIPAPSRVFTSQNTWAPRPPPTDHTLQRMPPENASAGDCRTRIRRTGPAW